MNPVQAIFTHFKIGVIHQERFGKGADAVITAGVEESKWAVTSGRWYPPRQRFGGRCGAYAGQAPGPECNRSDSQPCQ